MATEEIYQKPIPALARLVDQPRLPGARISPDYQWICFLQRPALETIEELSVPELKLAGLRFNPERYAPSSSLSYESMSLHNLKSGEVQELEGIPKGRIHVPSWSPDSTRLVFVLEQSDGLRLWSLERGESKAEELCPLRINGVLPGGFYRWVADSQSLLTRFVVEKDAPSQISVPSGPVIRETSGEKSPLRTYQDLLKDQSDVDLFEHYATSQLARIKINGEIEMLGQPAVNYTYRSSPNTEYILSRKLLRPYSFVVPTSRFPGSYELLDRHGETVKQLVEYPAAEDIPKGFDSVLTGPRQFDWRDDAPATLVWAEALDGGDMKAEFEFHDRIFFSPAPFQDPPQKLIDLELRYDGFQWGHEGLALVSEWRYSDRRVRTWAFSPSTPSEPRALLEDRSFNDHYKDPGQPLRVNGELGTRVLATLNSGQDLLLAGRGASAQGCIPFLDRWNAMTGKSERLWSSETPYYERVMGLLDNRGDCILTLRESVEEPPNFYFRNLAENRVQALTTLPHPTPDFRGIHKELITYRREDGVELSATLYLPAGHKEGPLPVVMWAYPLDYKSPEVAGQVTSSPYEFNRVSYWGPLPFLALGWAVLDDPKMPIVGQEDQQPNDTFLPQLISSAEAAVKTLVERGVSDGERLAIGGHSYGAFMVANLLAHCDLFKTGIARSGAYNRSLTPFGFQGEERDFWEGQEVYSKMSPFFAADKIKKPILIIHGDEDNNPGTYPMQSERLFAAIKGLGGQARLVMLPKESHAYRARESLLHMLWEQQEWLKKYL